MDPEYVPTTRSEAAWCVVVLAMLIAALVLGATPGCYSPGVDGQPISPIQELGITFSGEVKGEARQNSVKVGGYPLTYPIRIKGDYAYWFQYPAQPNWVFDGDHEIIVEPLSGYEEQVHDDIAAGRVVIRKNGQPAALSAVGTIKED